MTHKEHKLEPSNNQSKIKGFVNYLHQQVEDYKWPLIMSCWAAAFLLGYLGFREHSLSAHIYRTPWDNIYLSLQLFILESGSVSGDLNWMLQIARVLAPALMGYAALAGLAKIFHEQFNLIRIMFTNNHVIICGLGRKGLLFAERFREKGYTVVVIEQDDDNSFIGRCNEKGIVVFLGNATNPGLLHRSRVEKAKYLISVCGDDGVNVEVAVHVQELLRQRKGRALTCLVHVTDPQLCHLLREKELQFGTNDAFRLDFFNIFDSGSRILLEKYPPFPHKQEHSPVRPHIVIVGMGRLGENLTECIAEAYHRGLKYKMNVPRITIIDKHAQVKKDLLCLKNRNIEHICELRALDMDVQSPEFYHGAFLFDKDVCDVTNVYICLDNESLAITTALILKQKISSREISIILRMEHDTGLSSLLNGSDKFQDSFDNLLPFGLIDQACTDDVVSRGVYEQLAFSIHYNYLMGEMEKGLTTDDNPSMVPWTELPESLKESNRQQAEDIRNKLSSIGCDIMKLTNWDEPLFEFTNEEIGLMAVMEHDRFVKERKRDGWVKGPVKDNEKKTNPTLIPWDELSEEDKDKDRDAIKNMPQILADAGFKVCRVEQ